MAKYCDGVTRRDFVKQATIAAAAPAMIRAQAPAPTGAPALQTKEKLIPVPVRVGMTDWNLGQRGDISKIALAREIGLDGIQVSVQYPTDGQTPSVGRRGCSAQEVRMRPHIPNPELSPAERHEAVPGSGQFAGPPRICSTLAT